MDIIYEKPDLIELYHHGILGQKWGIRRYQNEDGTLTPAGKERYRDSENNTDSAHKTKNNSSANVERREKIKKAAIIAGVAIGVTAATVLYINNKDAVDNFVKKSLNKPLSKIKTSNEERILAKKAMEKAFVEKNKEKILKSPASLSRYKEYFSDDELNEAVKRFNRDKSLHNLAQDRMQRGSKYANAILGYGTAAVSLYSILNSPLAKDIKNKSYNKQDLSEMSDKELQDAINRERLERQYNEMILNKR